MNSPAKHFGLTSSQFKQLSLSDRLEMIEAYRNQQPESPTITTVTGEGTDQQEKKSNPRVFFIDLQAPFLHRGPIGNCCTQSQGTSAILDIETLATSPQSIITEIAIIIFDRATHTVIDHLEIFPDFFEQLAAGRAFDPDTLSFHRKNGNLPNGKDNQTPCLHAIVKMQEMFTEHQPKHVWIQGTDFDRPIIEDFCKAHNQPLPWRFSKSRDARTTYDLAFPGQSHPKRPHRALEDCQATLADLIQSLTKLNALESI